MGLIYTVYFTPPSSPWAFTCDLPFITSSCLILCPLTNFSWNNSISLYGYINKLVSFCVSYCIIYLKLLSNWYHGNWECTNGFWNAWFFLKSKYIKKNYHVPTILWSPGSLILYSTVFVAKSHTAPLFILCLNIALCCLIFL